MSTLSVNVQEGTNLTFRTCAYGVQFPVLRHISEILGGLRGWYSGGLASRRTALFSHVRPAARPALPLSLPATEGERRLQDGGGGGWQYREHDGGAASKNL